MNPASLCAAASPADPLILASNDPSETKRKCDRDKKATHLIFTLGTWKRPEEDFLKLRPEKIVFAVEKVNKNEFESEDTVLNMKDGGQERTS